MSSKFNDIDLVRQDLKQHMSLDQFVQLADMRYTRETGNACSPIERVNDDLYKKRCDLDEHPIGDDGSRDSTASFTICPPKELWHCFGCGTHGDRFEYISCKFHVDHIESIQIVAEIEDFNLAPYYVEITIEEQIKISLFQQNEIAKDMAHQALLSSERALMYLRNRGITDESIERFKLGFAPPLIEGSTIFKDIVNCQTLQLDKKIQFNNSILFPINDSSGKMRYFQARPFDPLPGMKYIGGDDSHPLFDEYDRIFGFSIAKKMLTKTGGRLVGVEGAPDCISCMQQGIVSVGLLGTNINQNIFDLLGKYKVTELILLLDGDEAGRLKSFKDAEKYIAIKTDVKLKIALMPTGYDPEEYINSFGADKLKECINEAVYAVQYLIDSKWVDANTPTAKIEYMQSIKQYMNSIEDKVIRQIMINHVSGRIGLDPIQIDDYYTEMAINSNSSVLYAPDGEELLLAEAIKNKDFITEILTRFKENDWCMIKHRQLFSILKNVEYTDLESLFTTVKNKGMDSVITYQWLEKLYNKTGNVEFTLKDVEDKILRRRALAILEESKSKVIDMNSDIALTVDKTSTGMFNVMHSKSTERIYDSKHQVNSVMGAILSRMMNPVEVIGDRHGEEFRLFDAYTLGSQNKTLTVVAANQSVGKTQLCENWAMYQSVVAKIPVLWFTLEMDEERMTYRNLAILSGINCQDIMTGNITLEEKSRIDQCAIQLMQSEFYLTDKGGDLTEALAIARKYVLTKHIRKIYVDYAQLQYVTDRKTETRSRELGVISKAWKEFSSDTGVAVYLISQLGRQALTSETAEAEHGFGSYEIAQDADNYITLKDKTAEEINARGIEHGNKTMNISKNRMGQKTVLIDIYADGPSYRMSECNTTIVN